VIKKESLEIIIRLENGLTWFGKSPLRPLFQRGAISAFDGELVLRLSKERSRGLYKRCRDDYENINSAAIGDRKEL